MKGMYLLIVSGLLFSSCNEAKRGNDSDLNETKNEAAAEENSDKFAGKKQRDAEFVYDVVASNYGKIKLAELANQKASTPEIKEIAENLLADHTTCLNELKTLAQAKAIAVPVEETDGARRNLENLADESNEEFEEEWAKEMIDMHDKDINKFEDRLEDTEDAELKTFISKTLPMLKAHREDLQGCLERIEEKNA